MTRQYETFDELPDPDCSYPVIVTVTHEHVIWVKADSLTDARDQVRADGSWYEQIDNSTTLASFGMDARSPGEDFHSWDWETVYRGDYCGPYQGLECDAHVQTYQAKLAHDKRQADMAACTADGHPQQRVFKRDGDQADEVYCPTCGYLPVKVAAA